MRTFFLIACLAILSFRPFAAFADGWKNVSFGKLCGGAEKTADGLVVKSSGNDGFCELEISPELLNEKYFVFDGSIKCSLDGTPKGRYAGPKFQLYAVFENGSEAWFDSTIKCDGKFNYAKISRFGKSVKRAVLRFGLQGVAGTIELKKPRFFSRGMWKPDLPEDFKCEYSHWFLDSPRMRGAMSPSVKLTDDDLKTFASWGGNVIRYQFTRHWNGTNVNMDVEEFFVWVDSKIAEIKSCSQLVRANGVKFVVDMHTPVGGRAYSDMRMFHEKKYADAFVESWRRIARALKDDPCVWAYDLINEPGQHSPAEVADWLELQWLAAKAIREIDPKTPIIVNGTDWGCPSGFLTLVPLPLPDIIYQAHMYMPLEYTHQGVFSWTSKPMSYPSEFRGEPFDKTAIEKYLKPVIDFQKKWGARIYIGEFGVIRWAEGGEKYLEDCISVFEKYGWDWSYHAFREWQGWSVEVGGDKDKPLYGVETDRKKVILKAFKKNLNPYTEIPFSAGK